MIDVIIRYLLQFEFSFKKKTQLINKWHFTQITNSYRQYVHRCTLLHAIKWQSREMLTRPDQMKCIYEKKKLWLKYLSLEKQSHISLQVPYNGVAVITHMHAWHGNVNACIHCIYAMNLQFTLFHAVNKQMKISRTQRDQTSYKCAHGEVGCVNKEKIYSMPGIVFFLLSPR